MKAHVECRARSLRPARSGNTLSILANFKNSMFTFASRHQNSNFVDFTPNVRCERKALSRRLYAESKQYWIYAGRNNNIHHAAILRGFARGFAFQAVFSLFLFRYEGEMLTLLKTKRNQLENSIDDSQSIWNFTISSDPRRMSAVCVLFCE